MRRTLTGVAVVAAASIFGLTYGLAAPLIAMNLEQRHASEIVIGLNAAMHAVGVLGVAPLLPAIVTRLGSRVAMLGALVLSATMLALFPLAGMVWLWFPLRLGLGVGAEVLFVVSETWTNDLVDERVRGRVIAIYTASLSVGFAGGPAILSLVGSGSIAYFVGAGVAIAAAIPLLHPSLVTPKAAPSEEKNPLRYVMLAPVAVAAALLNAAVETAGLSFIALYAGRLGWTEASALHLVSTLMVGAIVMQLPIGWLSDRMSPDRLALGLATVAALSALAWPFLLPIKWLAFAMIFLWGGVFVGVYTVVSTLVGSRFQGADRVGVYSAMSVAWGAGALIGPSLAGVAMGLSSRYGLPAFVSLACGAFAVFIGVSDGRRTMKEKN
jgi:MFS family permease